MRAERSRQLDSLAAVARVAGDLDPVVGRQDRLQRLSKKTVIVGDQDADRFWQVSCGFQGDPGS